MCCVLQGLFSTALHSHEEGPVWIFAKLQHHTHLQQSEGRHLKFIHFTSSCSFVQSLHNFHLSGKLSDIQNVVYNKLVKISCVATFAIVTNRNTIRTRFRGAHRAQWKASCLIIWKVKDCSGGVRMVHWLWCNFYLLEILVAWLVSSGGQPRVTQHSLIQHSESHSVLNYFIMTMIREHDLPHCAITSSQSHWVRLGCW